MLHKWMKTRPALLLALALLVAACPFALSGCDGAFGVEQTNLELNIEPGPVGSRFQFQPAVERFKELYPDVKVNIEYYNGKNDYESYKQYFTQLKTKLMTGKGPDIIYDFDVDNYFTDLYKMMKAGAFADMNEFMKNDPDFHMEDYNKTVMQSGMFQGKRYLIPLRYYVDHLVTTKGTLEESGFDLDAASPDWEGFIKTVLDYSSQPDLKIPVFSNNWADQHFFTSGNLPLINYETDSINYDRRDEAKEAARQYKDFCSLCPEPPAPSGGFVTGTESFRAFLERKSVFRRSHDFGNLSQWEYLDAHGDTLVFFPIRDREGKRCASASYVSVSNGSPNQQNAWNFIKVLLSSEIQEEFIDRQAVPVRLDVEDAFLEPYEEYRGKSETLDAAIDQFEELILNPESVYNFSLDGYSKLFDFMEDYFEGRTDDLDKSFDEALVKLERYMSE